MSVQKNQFDTQVKALCKDCNAFFGCQAFNGCCSSCFKKNQPVLKNQRKESAQTNVSIQNENRKMPTDIELVEVKVEVPFKKQQKDKKRCFTCNKKVGLLGIQCKCTFVFCNGHRLPQDHECDFNHQQRAKKKLESQMVKVEFQKIKEI